MHPPIFTICSINFLPQARTLLASVRKSDPSIDFTIFIVDEVDESVTEADLGCRIIFLPTLKIPYYYYMAFIYSVAELNTAVKPFCFKYMFSELRFENAIYLDPDIVVLKPLIEITRAFAGKADLVLTPHLTSPVSDDRRPSEIDILQAGVYNLGFCGLRNGPPARELLDWWGERLRKDCIFDVAKGLHVDQKFIDLAPGFVENTVIIRHPGYNLAYWNIHQRRITREDGALCADGEPVCFLHFSGVDFCAPAIFSRHQNRLTRSQLGELKPAYDDYLEAVAANRYLHGRDLSATSYSYGAFLDGMTIPLMLRRTYRHLVEPHLCSFEEMFRSESAVFNTRSSAWPQFPGIHISQLYDYIWNVRVDIQSVFPLSTATGQYAYLNWGRHALPAEYGIPAHFINKPPEWTPTECLISADNSFVLDDLLEPTFVLTHLFHMIWHGKQRAKSRLMRRIEKRFIQSESDRMENMVVMPPVGGDRS